MDQQLALVESLHQSVLGPLQPAAAHLAGAARHRHGCRKHLLPGATAAPFSSPMLLTHLAQSRLPPQLLAQLLAASADATTGPQVRASARVCGPRARQGSRVLGNPINLASPESPDKVQLPAAPRQV